MLVNYYSTQSPIPCQSAVIPIRRFRFSFPARRYPDPARDLPRPLNNHLSYAITWYGLAIALVVMFVLWARKVLNE